MNKQYPNTTLQRSTSNTPLKCKSEDVKEVDELRHNELLAQLAIRSNFYKL